MLRLRKPKDCPVCHYIGRVEWREDKSYVYCEGPCGLRGPAAKSRDEAIALWDSIAVTVSDSCVWAEDIEGNWETACGEMFTFIDGGPEENRVKFCHYCGLPIEPQYGFFPDYDLDIDEEVSE